MKEFNSENAIIVTLVHNCNDFTAFMSFLEPAHFDIKANKIIYGKMYEFALAQKKWDFVTIAQSLDQQTKLYLIEINSNADNSQIIDLAMQTAKTIVEKKDISYKKQRLESLAKELNSNNNDTIATDLIDLFNTDKEQTKDNINEILPNYYNWVTTKREFVDTQFASLNKIMGGGWEVGVHTIAGRPSMGKTAMMVTLANNDLTRGRKVGIISMEMDKNQIITRLISNKTGIDSHKIANYTDSIKDNNFRIDFANAYQFLESSPLFIEDKSSLTAIQLYNKIKLWKLNNKIEIVYIDHLGMIDHNIQKGFNPTYAIGDTMKWITRSAKDNNIPIVLLVQLSRVSDTKSDPCKFTLSDLSDSKSIEQFSHSVHFLVRPEFYEIKQFEYRNEKIDSKGLAILDTKKDRNGAIGKTLMNFTNYATKFEPFTIEKSNF